MPEPTRRKLLAVQWVDSKGVTSEWERVDELEPLEPEHCTTVGFLIDNQKDFVVLVQTVGGEHVLGRICIPKKAILKQTVLKLGALPDE